MAAQAPTPLRRVRRCNNFVLTSTLYPPHFHLTSHSHRPGCFGITLEGEFTEAFGSRSATRMPQTTFYRPPGEVHANATGRMPARCFVLEFPPHWVSEVGVYGRLPNVPRLFRGGRMTRLMHEIYRESQATDPASELAMEALILDLAATTIRDGTAGANHIVIQPWLRHVKARLDECFRDELSLTELANEAGIHPVHLSREFRAKFSVSLGEYVRGLRLEAAMTAIAHSDRSLIAIALECGYTNQSHFSTAFRRFTGMSPSQYRAKG